MSNNAHSVIWPIAKYQGWVGSSRKYNVVPVEDGTGNTKRTLAPAAYGVISIARDGGMPAELFGGFCEKNLCSESWDFVLVAVQYEMVRARMGTYLNHSRFLKRKGRVIKNLRGWKARASQRTARLVDVLGRAGSCYFAV